MADYIRNSILCQAYVHVDADDDFEESILKIDAFALPLVRERVSFFLYEDAEVKFDPDEGSVKSRITILGTLFLAMQGIAQYKDFREGVILLSEDVERVAQVAVTETLFALRARNKEIVRIEVRPGVVGSLRRIISEIDRISSDNGKIPTRLQTARLEALKDNVEKLIDNLQDADDVKLVADELYLLIDKLPQNPLPGPKEKINVAIVDSYRRKRSSLLESVRKEGDKRRQHLNRVKKS